MTQAAGDPVTDDRTADGAAHHEPGPRRGGRRVRVTAGDVEMHDEVGTTDAAATADGRGELVPAGEPGAGR